MGGYTNQTDRCLSVRRLDWLVNVSSSLTNMSARSIQINGTAVVLVQYTMPMPNETKHVTISYATLAPNVPC